MYFIHSFLCSSELCYCITTGLYPTANDSFALFVSLSIYFVVLLLFFSVSLVFLFCVHSSGISSTVEPISVV